jgi:hypothetical protein
MILILMFLPKGIVPAFARLSRRRAAAPVMTAREVMQ